MAGEASTVYGAPAYIIALAFSLNVLPSPTGVRVLGVLRSRTVLEVTPFTGSEKVTTTVASGARPSVGATVNVGGVASMVCGADQGRRLPDGSTAWTRQCTFASG